jgi:hypothetical protein
MLFWLAEAVEIPKATLDQAFDAVLSVPDKNASQCAALRRAVPWSDVESRLLVKGQKGIWPILRALIGR